MMWFDLCGCINAAAKRSTLRVWQSEMESRSLLVTGTPRCCMPNYVRLVGSYFVQCGLLLVVTYSCCGH